MVCHIEMFHFPPLEVFIDKAHWIQNMYKYVLQADRGEAAIKRLLGSAVAVGLTIHWGSRPGWGAVADDVGIPLLDEGGKAG